MASSILSVRDRPFTWSLVALCVALTVGPLVRDIDLGGVVYYVGLLLAIFGATESRWIRRASVIFAVLATIAHVGHLATESPYSGLPVFIIDVVFAGFIPVLVVRRVLSLTKIDAEEMSGALVSYALIGVFFGLVHALVNEVLPGAYNPGGPTASEADFTYYSFVTLTTLGYGDVVPVHAFARGVSILEAFIGQGYLAILVARLVAMRGVRPESDAA